MRVPMPKILQRRTVAEVATEAERLAASRAATVADIEALDQARPALLAEAEPAAILAHDEKRKLLAIGLEQADLRLAKIEEERVAAEAEAEQTRRKAVRAAGMKARTAGVEALEEYQRLAPQLAAALVRLAQSENAITAANAELPNGTAPIPSAEPDNSVPMQPERYGERTPPVVDERTGHVLKDGTMPPLLEQFRPGRAHISLRQLARIPAYGGKVGAMLFPPNVLG